MKNIKIIFTLVLSCATLWGVAQDKRDNHSMIGNGILLDFTKLIGTRPTIKYKYSPFIVCKSTSIICDSSTGALQFASIGSKIFDSNMVVIENGDHLIDSVLYYQWGYSGLAPNQGDILLPFPNKIYHITHSISDSSKLKGDIKTDRLYYSVIDPKANSGKGKVLSKKNVLLAQTIGVSGLQALRHANGIDWWVYKTGVGNSTDSLVLYRWLLTDTGISAVVIIKLPPPTEYYSDGGIDGAGIQINEQGTKMLVGRALNFYMADVNRCSGKLANIEQIEPKECWKFWNPDGTDTFQSFVTPEDSTWDKPLNGLCFSPNGKYIYIIKKNSLWQWEYQSADTNNAWQIIRAGGDTTWLFRSQYTYAKLCPDGRIYIGCGGGGAWQVIDSPDVKGLGCALQLRKIYIPLGNYPNFGMQVPSNTPNYKLGVDYSSCWPLANEQLPIINTQFTVYPNPTNTAVTIDVGKATKQTVSISNTTGQQVYTQVIVNSQTSIDVSRWVRGVYFVRVGNVVKKLLVE
jgi:Secretion system C-terminal sorting domain